MSRVSEVGGDGNNSLRFDKITVANNSLVHLSGLKLFCFKSLSFLPTKLLGNKQASARIRFSLSFS